MAILAGRVLLAIPALGFAAVFARQRGCLLRWARCLPTPFPLARFLQACLVILTALSYLPALAPGSGARPVAVWRFAIVTGGKGSVVACAFMWTGGYAITMWP
jgi:K+-transporting ATPase A subunit